MLSENQAAGRLSVLSRHLSTASPEDGVARNNTAAEDTRPAPGGGRGTLTVVDNRTGKKYTIEVSDNGTIKADALKQIKAGGDNVGLRTYDPGYLNTSAVISRICFIDGEKGILRYRGIPIEDLAARSNFTETAYLVLYGNLPTQQQLISFREAVMRHSALPTGVLNVIAQMPHDAHPMGILMTGICALSTMHPEQNPALAGQNIYKSKETQDKQIVRLLGKVPTLAALAYHKASGRFACPPNQHLDYAENFLYMLDGGTNPNYRPNPKLARALDIMFILHAEHEMNCSTAAVRHLASSNVDVYTAVAGGVGALYGPLHGGANEAVLRMLARIGSVDNIPTFIEGVKNKKEKLFGFGHRVYRNFDPRAVIIKRVAEEDVFPLVGVDPLIEIAKALEEAALSDEYFVSRKLYPNVDFYSGLVYRALGFPTQFFTVLFAIPRIVGYCSHWRESLSDPDTKILRPQQDYKGVWLRPYIDISNRSIEGSDTLAKLPPSNAYNRRIAGSNWQ